MKNKTWFSVKLNWATNLLFGNQWQWWVLIAALNGILQIAIWRWAIPIGSFHIHKQNHRSLQDTNSEIIQNHIEAHHQDQGHRHAHHQDHRGKAPAALGDGSGHMTLLRCRFLTDWQQILTSQYYTMAMNQPTLILNKQPPDVSQLMFVCADNRSNPLNSLWVCLWIVFLVNLLHITRPPPNIRDSGKNPSHVYIYGCALKPCLLITVL